MIEWGDYSDSNTVGALIFVEPYKMAQVTRGFQTSESVVQILWTEIVADSTETGGAPIDSYNLQWKIKDSPDAYTDLVGEDGNYLVADEHI